MIWHADAAQTLPGVVVRSDASKRLHLLFGKQRCNRSKVLLFSADFSYSYPDTPSQEGVERVPRLLGELQSHGRVGGGCATWV